MSWASDGVRRWWQAHRHRGHAVSCALCGHGFDAWDDGGRCWRCRSEPPQRAAWAHLALHPELLRDAERVALLAPPYGLRNRIAQESGFELVTVGRDVDHANVAVGALDAGSVDGAVLTQPEDRAEAERLVRSGGWLVDAAGVAFKR